MNSLKNNDMGFAGTLSNIQLNDLIQVCGLSGANTIIRVNKGARQGEIFIKNGEIVHAVCDLLSGEKAFYQILAWHGGGFETREAILFPKITINKNLQFLLMEAARIIDENEFQPQEESTKSVFNDLLVEDENSVEPNEETLKVLIVDDSSMMCKILEEILSGENDISVVGTAKNGEEALEAVSRLKPDLITLDVNMPVMDGSTALKHIMIKSPCPIVIISNMSSHTQTNILDFLRLGAVDFINKPVHNKDITDQKDRIIKVVKQAGKAAIKNFIRVKEPVIIKSENNNDLNESCEKLVIINSGAGGLAELIRIIPQIPFDGKTCILCQQIMPAEFLEPFAKYLNQRSQMDISAMHTAKDIPVDKKYQITGGHCYISSNSFEFGISKDDENFFVNMMTGVESKTSRALCFEALLDSICKYFNGKIITVILSGAEIEDIYIFEKIMEKNGDIIIQRISSCIMPFKPSQILQTYEKAYEISPLMINKTMKSLK